jgi:hypothetical protein
MVVIWRKAIYTDPKLTLTDYAVALAYFEYSGDDPSKWCRLKTIYPSRATIANMVNSTEKTVGQAVERLAARGWFYVDPESTKGGKHKSLRLTPEIPTRLLDSVAPRAEEVVKLLEQHHPETYRLLRDSWREEPDVPIENPRERDDFHAGEFDSDAA